jgi:hypothetical protein
MTSQRYFVGDQGAVATSAAERCYLCKLAAAYHTRDVNAGRDRLLCPDDQVIANLTGQVVAAPRLDRPDRLGAAMDLSKSLYGDDPTLDQSLTVPYVAQMLPGGRRSGKANGIRARMKSLKLTRDEQKEFSRLLREQTQAEIAEAERELQAREAFEAKRRLMEEEYRARLLEQFARGKRYIDTEEDPGRVADFGLLPPAVFERLTPAPKQLRPPPTKPAPSVAVGTPRAYFEDE